MVWEDGRGDSPSYPIDNAKTVPGVVSAQCWTHTRREFVKAESAEPEAVAEALDLIGALYHIEAHIRDKGYDDKDTLACRAERAKPAVDAFFAWCDAQCQRLELVPSDRLSKALKYALKRQDALRLYLSDPQLPMDTNHLERTLRVIPMGRNYPSPMIMQGWMSATADSAVFSQMRVQ